ncbi:ribbon-helix-helix domain-containing protein [Actinomadura rudentiformis]|uniref:hypothetical protein n=1 Tax=Actinomadura rudentiformis TaxID=359158 RepID=UPI001CEF7A76|nr:hypothetical protein [Actinomadura rudentiformis]
MLEANPLMKNSGAASETHSARLSGRREADDRDAAPAGPVGERVTVNLSLKARDALEEIMALTGINKTDSISRALVVYAEIERMAGNGGSIYCRESPDGDLMKWKIV